MKSFRSRARDRTTTTSAYIVKESEGGLKGAQEEERLPHVVVVGPH